MDDELEPPTENILVVAEHPSMGRIYWQYISEREVNAPDFYGLTAEQAFAAWPPTEWRQCGTLCPDRQCRDLGASEVYRFLAQLLDECRLGSEYRTAVDDEGQFTEHLTGSLKGLHLQSGQTTEDFIRWIWTAEWSVELSTAQEE